MGRRRRRSSSSSEEDEDEDDATSSSSSTSSSSPSSSSSSSSSPSSASTSSSSSSSSHDDGHGSIRGSSRLHHHHHHHHHRKRHQKSESRKIRSSSTGSKRSKKRRLKDDHSSSSRKDRTQRKKRDYQFKETLKKSNQKKRRKENEHADADRISHSKKKKSQNLVEDAGESNSKLTTNNPLQIALSVQEQQKAMIRHNAEIAKARLASGELQRAREEQAKMLELYGTIDWRAKKKLRTEKKKLEQTVAAGKKLASFEEREHARMDAFRVALGLPTAEAQRQAEWRAEATQALLDLENSAEVSMQKRSRSMKNGIIGPTLPP